MEHKDTWKQMRRQLAEVGDAIDGALGKMPGIGNIVRGGYPPVNVYDGPDEVVVRAEVAGVAREDLDVSLLQNVLIISGKLDLDKYEDYDCRLCERCGSEFCREVKLPAGVDDEADVVATLREGVLTVRLKKALPEQGRTIEVESE